MLSDCNPNIVRQCDNVYIQNSYVTTCLRGCAIAPIIHSSANPFCISYYIYLPVALSIDNVCMSMIEFLSVAERDYTSNMMIVLQTSFLKYSEGRGCNGATLCLHRSVLVRVLLGEGTNGYSIIKDYLVLKKKVIFFFIST